MKAIKLLLPTLISFCMMTACNNSNDNASNNNSSPGVNDTTATDPTTDAMDYHNDQRQRIPVTDSSNTVGTDTINGSVSTPNTGTQKSYNDAKGNEDSSQK